MEIKIANQGILAVFFLYLVMIGGDMSSLLNCELQRLLQKSIILRHVITFLSIFLFTFILNWYTPKSLVLTENMKNKKQNKYKYLLNSFKYSIFIYILYILSSKQEHSFIYTFLILLLIIISVYIVYLIEINSHNLNQNNFNKFFISQNDVKLLVKDKNESYKIYLIHNILSSLYLILLINILIGVYLYYIRQLKDKKNQFSLLKFIFGSKNCRGVATGFESAI